MFQYVLRRLVYVVPMLLIVSFVSFVVITLPPGDYMTTFQNRLVNQSGMSQDQARELAQRMRKRYGLDQSFIMQYFSWVKNIVLNGEFGYSFQYNRPVSEVIWGKLGYTFLIALSSHLISVLIGVIVGIYSATHQYSLGDNIATIFAFIGLSIPNFFFAIVIMYILSFHLNMHVGGLFSSEYVFAPWNLAKFVDFMKHFWVPVFVVGIAGTAQNMRIMRGNLLDELQKQYVQTARAKGLKEGIVIYKHAVRNAIQPLVMYLGMALPFLIQGAIVSSIVLELPTTGPAFYEALLRQDMYLAGTFLLMLAVMLVIGNLLADILLAQIDPRVRYE